MRGGVPRTAAGGLVIERLVATTAPGTNAMIFEPGTALLIKAGSVLTFQIHYTASGGYLAMSTDASLVEEYLRSTESQGKTLRQTSGLTEAAQKVTGPGTTLFGYQNQVETMRALLELLKKDPGSLTNASPLASTPGVPNPQALFKDWFDFSLLPPFDKISKYFHFAVYGGSATSQGLSFKLFSPAPPQLKTAQSSGK